MASASTILVIDDEADLLAALRMLLEARGYSVECAEDGGDALKRFQAGGVDIVLLDMCLPDIGGLSLLELIRRTDPSVPVVVLTAFPTEKAGKKALELGAREFLAKPVDFKELANVLYFLLSAERGRRPEVVVPRS